MSSSDLSVASCGCQDLSTLRQIPWPSYDTVQEGVMFVQAPTSQPNVKTAMTPSGQRTE